MTNPTPTPSIEETKMPFDLAALKGRTCSNCACYFESVNPDNPNKFQGFCRRNIADLIQLRGEVPRTDLQGNVVMKDGKPVMNSEMIAGYVYKVTQRQGTCFDGYRVPGTLPGERNMDTAFREYLPDLFQQLEKYLTPELRSSLTRLLVGSDA